MSRNLYSAVLGVAISEQKTAPLRIHMQYRIYVVQLWNQFSVFVNNEPTQYDFIKIDLFFFRLEMQRMQISVSSRLRKPCAALLRLTRRLTKALY